MMRRRSIAAAIAFRTRTSSNGGRTALNTMPFDTSTGYETTRSDGSRDTSAAMVGAMPATASSPLTSPANFVVGSSTTATTSRSTVGGPPSSAGKLGTRSKTQRRPAHRAVRDVAQEVRGKDRQLGEHRRKTRRRRDEANDDGGVVRGLHRRD